MQARVPATLICVRRVRKRRYTAAVSCVGTTRLGSLCVQREMEGGGEGRRGARGRVGLESFCTCHPESPSHETELLPPLASTCYWLLVYTPPDPQLFLSRKLRLRTFVSLNRANSVALTQDFRNGMDDSSAEFIGGSYRVFRSFLLLSARRKGVRDTIFNIHRETVSTSWHLLQQLLCIPYRCYQFRIV